MDQQVIECYLPNSNIIENFLTYNNSEKEKIIELGLSLYKQGLDTIKYWDNKDWEDRIKKLTIDKELHETQKNQEISTLKENIQKNYHESKKEKEDLVFSIKNDYEIRYSSEINRQRNYIDELTSQISEWGRKYNELYQTLDDKFQIRLKEQNERSDELIKSLRDEISKEKERFEQQMVFSQNSTLKGQQGEEHIYIKLNQLFPSAEIIDTHTETGRGDFILKLDDITCMVENKNYSKNVQKSEIDKFYRDLDRESNNDIQCAVLISMHTGICGREDFTFEVRNNKPILFLHKLCNNFTNLNLAFKFFKLIINQKNLDLNNKEISGLFKNIAINIKRNFKKLKKQLDKFHAEQTETLLHNEENIINLYTSMKLTY